MANRLTGKYSTDPAEIPGVNSVAGTTRPRRGEPRSRAARSGRSSSARCCRSPCCSTSRWASGRSTTCAVPDRPFEHHPGPRRRGHRPVVRELRRQLGRRPAARGVPRRPHLVRRPPRRQPRAQGRPRVQPARVRQRLLLLGRRLPPRQGAGVGRDLGAAWTSTATATSTTT